MTARKKNRKKKRVCGEITSFPPTQESLAKRWLFKENWKNVYTHFFPSSILKITRSTRFKVKVSTDG